jgi:hypothetical protein
MEIEQVIVSRQRQCLEAAGILHVARRDGRIVMQTPVWRMARIEMVMMARSQDRGKSNTVG